MSLPSLAEDVESGIYTPCFYINTSPTFYDNCTRSIGFVAPIHAYLYKPLDFYHQYRLRRTLFVVNFHALVLTFVGVPTRYSFSHISILTIFTIYW